MMKLTNSLSNFTETEEQLIKKLIDVWKNKDFVFCIINSLKTDDERQTMIDFIDAGENVSADTLNLLSLHIVNERNKK